MTTNRDAMRAEAITGKRRASDRAFGNDDGFLKGLYEKADKVFIARVMADEYGNWHG